MLIIFIGIIAILLQLSTAFLAFRLIKVTGKRWAWTMVVVAMLLMFVRRIIALGDIVNGGDATSSMVITDTFFTFMISIAMLVGVVGIGSYFSEMEKSIAKRKKAEDELSKVHDALESSVNGVIIANLDGEITYVNSAFMEMFEYEKIEQVIGNPASKLFATEKIQKFADVTTIIDKVKGETEDFTARRKDGTLFPVEVSSSIVTDKNNNTIGRMASFVNITKRKKAEKLIVHQNRVLRAIRNVNQLIVQERDRDKLLDSVCNILIENRDYYNAWIALFDGDGTFITTAEAGLGKVFLPMLELLKDNKMPACIQLSLPNEGVSLIDRALCSDCPGFDKDAETEAMFVRIEHGDRIYGMLSVTLDKDYATLEEEQGLFSEVAGDIAFALFNMELEEERNLGVERIKEEYKRAEFYNDLMSHDIRNYNQGAMSNLELLLMSENYPDEYKRNTQNALSQVIGSSNLISNLRKLGEMKATESELRSIELLPVFQDAEDRVRTQFPNKHLEIVSDISEKEYKVIANELLTDVFVNLLGNAMKFDRRDVVQVGVCVSEVNNDFCKIEIKDNGSGVDDIRKAIILDRYNMGEPSVSGSGLGLTLVKHIIEGYGGRIWIEDRVEGVSDQGSNFVFLIPRGGD
ncbi:MAG: PAS domain S-box protein [Candidatus Thermoplasmatota archaeon]|nr:PAS domain S-box protein [Euryarchaeota archaeon]MBU4031220.1 PAS domain S-box protein [Candidatus Thermoplasmatota archaeon]MBU4071691.1 PAS domain S-box protein [Candidatus Thermoplasmatota archaeon]MBU4143753.1 PAS domain S-box protein [Candidatus Thermoplasmatota archaeon]MBU4592436.1 PAS domain S-box protein [Candidatus Thermoplasmatota archaeon]